MVLDNSLTTEVIWANYEAAVKAVPTLEKPFKVDMFNYEIVADPKLWTEDYFHEAASCLNTNLNKERYKNVLNVRDHLAKKGNPKFKGIVSKSTNLVKGSVDNARKNGVQEDKILKNEKDLENFLS